MFLSLLTLFVVTNMWNKLFWLIIARSSHVLKEMIIGVLFVLQKMREVVFFLQKGEIGKIVEEGYLGRVT